jgi:hypothetical protein
MSLPGGKFTPEQVTRILAVTCEPPEKSDRPITHWTSRELADEVTKRGIVESIAPARVGRSLRETALPPLKSRSWLNTTEKDPVASSRTRSRPSALVLKPLTRPTEKSSRNSHNRA